jgi:benzoyl-CoA reductase subunit A
MKCVVGIDLGSTTTKAVLLDESGAVLGRGITNSRSNYEVACSVARIEAITSARLDLLQRALDGAEFSTALPRLREAFRFELYLADLEDLRKTLLDHASQTPLHQRRALDGAARRILDAIERTAPELFLSGQPRKSAFFRDLAGAAFIAEAEKMASKGEARFEPLVALYDRAILEVETRMRPHDTRGLLFRALRWLKDDGTIAGILPSIERAIEAATSRRIEEAAVVGTGYGRQTLPFAKEAVRSEILCHGRGAHRVFDRTRTVLDIGGQDTKAIQVDEQGVVTSFQMNDRCAAGCGRYLGYIADELNLGLHELGPLALRAKKPVKVNSTCTVFAGAEIRERLALGQQREDILAGLHRAIMLRAMSLLARSGGVRDELTFTGGVCNNPMATKILRELVDENYGAAVTLNIHPDSIYMGALGAALFALDDLRTGRLVELPSFIRMHHTEAVA